MFDRLRSLFVLVMVMLAYAGSQAFAEDAAWRVGKLSGDVAITSSEVQPAALTDGTMIKPGDAIRTGRNGRVLLLRGEESILIEPNSLVGIPAEKKDTLSTTILQKAGSILLDVEKRNVKHFAVETPYLAAVVKGTLFRVTVNKTSSRVEVLRGQVEVSDFRSGKFALVLPGQTARVSAQGAGGLTLSGSGTLSPIQKGEPRAPSVKPTPATIEGRPALRSASGGQQLRIAAPLGEVKLDVSKATQGLIRASSGDNAASRASAPNDDGGSAYAKSDGGGLSARSAALSGGGISAGLSLSGGGTSVGGISTGGTTGGAVAAPTGATSSGGSGGLLAGVVGTATGLVGGLTKKLKLSDIRLKRDIVLVDRLDNGLGLYRYRYLWSDTAYVGVMAQEVELVRSDAVSRGSDGYLRVDYAALGLPFQTYDQWTASSGTKEIRSLSAAMMRRQQPR